MRNPPEEPPCAECWPDAMPENKEAILVFLPLCRQFIFDPNGRIVGPNVASVTGYIEVMVKEKRRKMILVKVLRLINKVGIPKYVDGVSE